MEVIYKIIIFGGIGWAVYYFVSGWIQNTKMPEKIKLVLSDEIPADSIYTETTSIRDGAPLFYVGIGIDQSTDQIRILIAKNTKSKMRDQRVDFSSITGLREDSYENSGKMYEEVVINTSVSNLSQIRLSSYDSTKRLMAALRSVSGQ